jgi:peptidoglycan/LPS O-acetylase OafA/YrhL
MPQVSGADKNFPALTSIRMVAATMVFISHYDTFVFPIFPRFIHDYFEQFHVGVTIFFVLSGFLIYHRYAEKLPLGRISLREYFVNRFARIYPMYFIVTVLAFLFGSGHAGFDDTGGVVFLNLSFLRGFFDDYKFTGVSSGWSLTVEEMFYLLFPLVIFAGRKLKFIFQPLIFLGIGLSLWICFRNISFHGFFSSLQFLFEFTFFGRCVEFYAGMALAMYINRRRSLVQQGKRCYRTMGGVVAILLCIYLMMLNHRHTGSHGPFIFFETLINNFVLPFGIVLFFYGVITEGSMIRRILETGPLVLLGKSSYVFYLIHVGFLFPLLYSWLGQRLQWVYLAMQLISVIGYLIIEKPLNRLIRGKFSKPGNTEPKKA